MATSKAVPHNTTHYHPPSKTLGSSHQGGSRKGVGAGGVISPTPIHDPDHLVGGWGRFHDANPCRFLQCVDPCLRYVCELVVYIVTIM